MIFNTYIQYNESEHRTQHLIKFLKNDYMKPNENNTLTFYIIATHVVTRFHTRQLTEK